MATITLHEIVDQPTDERVELNNVIKVPVILAKALVQSYGADEFPLDVQEELAKGRRGKQKVYMMAKPYKELKAAIVGVDKLPIILNHTHMVKDFNDPARAGCVRNIVADDARQILRGMGFFIEKRLPAGLAKQIKDKEVIAVSIGFTADLLVVDADGFDVVQTNIVLNHLAVLTSGDGRCPRGVCGLNLDSVPHGMSEDKVSHLHTEDCVECRSTPKTTEPVPPQTLPSAEMTNLTQGDLIGSPGDIVIRDLMADDKELAEVKRVLAETQAKMLTLQDAQSTKAIEGLQADIKSLKTQNETLEKAVGMKDSAMVEMKTALDKALKDIKQYDADKKTVLIDSLVKAKYDTKENLEKEELGTLQLRVETLRKAKVIMDAQAIAAVQDHGFPKPEGRKIADTQPGNKYPETSVSPADYMNLPKGEK